MTPSPKSSKPVVVEESSVFITTAVTRRFSVGMTRKPAPRVLYGSRRATTELKTNWAFMNCDLPRPEANSFRSLSSVSILPPKTPNCSEKNCTYLRFVTVMAMSWSMSSVRGK